ncbi:DUF3006 domain-containing protein [Allobacillus sp. GCM10007491]|uniref:DUF3006 domain-containing protein n=1 Tax=Allobacillus saliphilus TaxID=2912308 RepID=A0A941CYH4_9BACI|nr:DUF3006 domain-containing protein [Allobacillus saliphilus]MBR7554743.1 DUF3006 domain-containing protein [Allobacillus saliphilus]MBR7554930.1 DUF3006 domain-containing protein [Allobacillus saliphilus]
MSKYEGVLDRIEDGHAVILVEEDKKDFLLPANHLPDSIQTGSQVEVTIENGEVSDIKLIDTNADRKTSLENRLNKLRSERDSRRK